VSRLEELAAMQAHSRLPGSKRAQTTPGGLAIELGSFEAQWPAALTLLG
jgi:hypothetical protein